MINRLTHTHTHTLVAEDERIGLLVTSTFSMDSCGFDLISVTGFMFTVNQNAQQTQGHRVLQRRQSDAFPFKLISLCDEVRLTEGLHWYFISPKCIAAVLFTVYIQLFWLIFELTFIFQFSFFIFSTFYVCHFYSVFYLAFNILIFTLFNFLIFLYIYIYNIYI